MGLAPLFAIGAAVGAGLLGWFVYGLNYTGFQAVRLLFLVSTLPLWLASVRATRYSNEAQALFKSLGKRVPKEFGQVSTALTTNAGWARPGLLQDYQRWQRIISLLGGIAIAWMLGAFVVGVGVLQRG
jgi:hypothetical protein